MMENRQSSYPNTYRMNSTAAPVAQNRGPVVTAQPMQKPCKKELMDKINQYSFAVNEANLYLDTHPFDTEALAYFQKYRELRVEAIKEYAKYYGPLTVDTPDTDSDSWNWICEPWPWQMGGC